MAKKRRIEVERSEEPEEIDVPDKFKESSWSEWVRNSYAKWWYGILCMFLDLLLAIEISNRLYAPWNYFIPTIVVILLLIIELYIFHRIWGGLGILFENKKFL